MALRLFGDVWVRWGDSTADRAEAILHVRGTPTTPEDIFTAIGTDSASYRALRETLYADHRFIRASRQAWGLRAWGIDEYAGVFDEIATRIDASGGKANIDKLIRNILSRFPDVAENSVRAYLSTLAFICEAGMVRRRTDTDEWPPVPALNTARGAFRNGDNEIRLAIPVTIDMLRGSGLQLRPAVAAALGVSPGQQRIFSSPARPGGRLLAAFIYQRPQSRVTPVLGNSPRRHSRRHPGSGVPARRIHSGCRSASAPKSPGSKGCGRLLGRTVRKPAAALAASLDCRRAEVAAAFCAAAATTTSLTLSRTNGALRCVNGFLAGVGRRSA